MLCMYAGSALILGELHALLGLLTVAVAYGRKIPQEERALRAAFGAEYDAYRRESRALIPWVL